MRINNRFDSASDRLDYLLDKISKYSISSISELELLFLDSYSSGEEYEIHEKLSINETIFVDDNEMFKFELSSIRRYKGETHYIGTIYVPDLLLFDDIIPGILNGKIVQYENGTTSPDFFHTIDDIKYWDIFDFCNGLEYELDNFIDRIIMELKK
jgi:hypothetical protein